MTRVFFVVSGNSNAVQMQKKAYNPSVSQEPAKPFGSLGQAFLLVGEDLQFRLRWPASDRWTHRP